MTERCSVRRGQGGGPRRRRERQQPVRVPAVGRGEERERLVGPLRDERQPARTRDRSLAVNTCGPGPAAYSPRGNTLSGPKYTMSMKHDTEKDMSVGPGPANYTPAADRFGTATIGDAPSYSLTSRNKGKRYISREHAKTDGQGVHSPAPDTYLPLEQMGITNTTVRAQFLCAQFGAQFSDAARDYLLQVSNTSTHAPIYSFGTEKRDYQKEAEIMRWAAERQQTLSRTVRGARVPVHSLAPAPSPVLLPVSTHHGVMTHTRTVDFGGGTGNGAEAE